jgi:hypothetical protein
VTAVNDARAGHHFGVTETKRATAPGAFPGHVEGGGNSMPNESRVANPPGTRSRVTWTGPVTPRDEAPRCPGCGEDWLVEWDAGLRHWFCHVCGRTWRVT